ncbi:hypothetical protein AB4Z09_04505 [Rhodococcus sp. TAF43]|uniref:hypothetical protein n=1 Tax=unclassified Rhodococcus (in: high G+C Gram-positive bacteria) TaxID=192944 RepID=UPI0015836199|nr:hypothetical protein [Rhodococcus sp. W8901]QKT13516.1 hypothetical protein HUN07_24720 [Rhodococcus sp. W8901]
MQQKRNTRSGETSANKPYRFKYKDITAAAGAGAALLGGDSPELAVGKGVAARGFAGATQASYHDQLRWRAKVANTHGFWRKLKVIVIG